MNDRIFCGNGKQITDWKIGISVCLDDIPQEYITRSRNGKQYINLDVCERKGGADQYGKTHSVEVNTWKPERQATTPPAASRYAPPPPPKRAPQYQNPGPEMFDDDIPF